MNRQEYLQALRALNKERQRRLSEFQLQSEAYIAEIERWYNAELDRLALAVGCVVWGR